MKHAFSVNALQSVRSWFLVLAATCAGCGAGAPPIRVCADPNNLPLSNSRSEGFENKIAELIARELGRPLQYVWWAQRRGFVRNALLAGKCDLVPGIVTGVERVATTRPYYRSAYMFVAPPGSKLQSFDDPQLRRLRIGVQIVGDDYANTPPVHALARRGIVHVRGYRVAGDYATPNPPARIIDAVANGEVDAAIAWGPLAGYFVQRQAEPLAVFPIHPAPADYDLPLAFEIAMGVRKEDRRLLRTLDAVLERRRNRIARILASYDVPIVPDP